MIGKQGWSHALTMREILPSYRMLSLVVFGSPYGTTMVLRAGAEAAH